MCRRRIQRRVARDLVRTELPVDEVQVVDADGPRHTFRLRKHGRLLVVTANCGAMASNTELAGVFRNRSLAILDPFVRSRATEAIGEVSDGEESGPGTISFSAFDPDAILIPDSIFYRSRGYDYQRDGADRWQVDWAARREQIVWRGSTTGRGQISTEEMAANDTKLILRTRMCLMLRATPDVDARLINVAQSAEPARDKLRLEQADILGSHIHPGTWFVRKFAIDVDGNSNAWSNLFTRLLAGCCVIKIASPSGYRQWYYDALRPWEHFVPAKADLSDLHEKIDWCRAHDRQCAEIAAAGRDFALRRDFETEMRGAVETLNARLAGI